MRCQEVRLKDAAMPWGPTQLVTQWFSAGHAESTPQLGMMGRCSIDQDLIKFNDPICQQGLEHNPSTSKLPVLVSTNHSHGGSPISGFPVVKVVQVPTGARTFLIRLSLFQIFPPKKSCNQDSTGMQTSTTRGLLTHAGCQQMSCFEH